MTRAVVEIRLGLGSCCVASGSRDVYDAAQRTVKAMHASAVIRQAGCVGMCHSVPLMEVIEPGGRRTLYGNVKAAAVPAILRRHLKPRCPAYYARRAWKRLTRDDAWQKPEGFVIDCGTGVPPVFDRGTGVPPVGIHGQVAAGDSPRRDGHATAAAQFLGPQVRIATEHCGQMDPTDIAEYRAAGGYDALLKAVTTQAPGQVIDEITRAGLRGRGGAGFPTGRKWRVVGDQPAGKKYVICNGDEGDPGAFMDRMLLEAYPHRIIEGIAIAAFAVGADEAILYIRQEYPLAVERVAEAIRQAEAAGCIGASVFGTPVSLKVSIKQGSGAFVCGEETALIASIEGRRGMPRLRPPYPAASGLWGRPTCVNNVETLAAVPWILRQGTEAFAAIGTESSKGTKVFSLTGKVVRGGLIEVPMGVTVRQIVEAIGGGIKDGKRFKAVQIGGPSGGCIPENLADTPIDYEALTHLGAIMGSGGLVVLDDTDCMVDIARYFLQFTQNESCGQCTFCRVGTKRMLEILNRIVNGQGQADDLDALESLALQVKSSSLCGLGQTAPNPVLTTLKYFRAEYEAHIAGRCPAGRCTALVDYKVTDDCIGCTVCAQVCPVDAIERRPYAKHFIDMSKCTCCHQCVLACPADAIRVE